MKWVIHPVCYERVIHWGSSRNSYQSSVWYHSTEHLGLVSSLQVCLDIFYGSTGTLVNVGMYNDVIFYSGTSMYVYSNVISSEQQKICVLVTLALNLSSHAFLPTPPDFFWFLIFLHTNALFTHHQDTLLRQEWWATIHSTNWPNPYVMDCWLWHSNH